MKELCLRALDVARGKGAAYADARIIRTRRQEIATEDQRVSSVSDGESAGMGVRVIAEGAWGFAAAPRLDNESVENAAVEAIAIARAAALAKAPEGIRWAREEPRTGCFRTPVRIDPFTVPLEEKIALLLAINAEVLKVKGVRKCHSHMQFKREWRLLANSDGSLIESETCTSGANYQATAVDESTAKRRNFSAYARNIGYEHIRETPLLAEATRVGEEAVAQLKGKPCPVGRKDLVLHPSHLCLTMHESIGHATELDRVLGMEESLAGSSFATVDQLDSLRYGSPLMNVICDNTMPHGLASRGWDDDGVEAQRWPVIRDGILVDYQTSREVCHAIGATRSHGSCRADSWASIPIIRQSNLGLAPGTERLSLEELIGDTKDGIYIEGTGSFSIDQRRHNFQFGGDCFWEIKNGRKGAILKDVTYQAITTEFWGSLDAVCDERFWTPYGVTNCGKGDPQQIAQMTHGSAPARFRQISVGGAR
ncbi:MAG: TldD/PmbA family protein [Candidatus Sumerlaeota bacterium]|nr:TldD/PmbA family protein [Candidatus Sumerlaeota bacterium]